MTHSDLLPQGYDAAGDHGKQHPKRQEATARIGRRLTACVHFALATLVARAGRSSQNIVAVLHVIPVLVLAGTAGFQQCLAIATHMLPTPLVGVPSRPSMPIQGNTGVVCRLDFASIDGPTSDRLLRETSSIATRPVDGSSVEPNQIYRGCSSRSTVAVVGLPATWFPLPTNHVTVSRAGQ